MKTKKVVLTVILGAGMLFTSCEKEEAQSPSNSASANSEILKSSNSQQKNGLYSEEQVFNYIEDMDEETAIVVSEVSQGQYEITSKPFNPNSINNPPSSNSVWPNNEWGRAQANAEARDLLHSTGCVRVDKAYGWIAVNAC